MTSNFWPIKQLKESSMTSRMGRTKDFYILLNTPDGKFYTKIEAHVQRDAEFYVTHHYPHFPILKIMSSGQFWMHKKHNPNSKELPKEYV